MTDMMHARLANLAEELNRDRLNQTRQLDELERLIAAQGKRTDALENIVRAVMSDGGHPGGVDGVFRDVAALTATADGRKDGRCVLKIVPTGVFNRANPIVLGVEVVSGAAEVGMRLRLPSDGGGIIRIGRIAALELNTRSVQVARAGERVAVKIDAVDPSVEYGRDFDADDVLVGQWWE